MQIDGGLFVRLCKSTGVCLSACAKMTGVYLSGGLFVRNPLSEHQTSLQALCQYGNSYLRSTDDGLSCLVTSTNHHLLGEENLLWWDFDSQVTTGNHYTINHLQDLIKPINRLCIYN